MNSLSRTDSLHINCTNMLILSIIIGAFFVGAGLILASHFAVLRQNGRSKYRY